MNRTIQQIITAPLVNMGPIQLRQSIPFDGIDQISPFLLLHHFDLVMKPGENLFDVPPHPHRGFSPITFMFAGSVEHNDSLGNKRVIGENEAQWINAGRGLIHSEKASSDFVTKGGRFHGIQLWINSERKDKMRTPYYKPVTKTEIPIIEQSGVQVRLISGEIGEHHGPANSATVTAMVAMNSASEFTFQFPAGENVLVYVLEGQIEINGVSNLESFDMAISERSEGNIKIKSKAQSSLLVLAGEPIDEPIAAHGPFVMNDQTEILEAMRDYQSGRMGFLY